MNILVVDDREENRAILQTKLKVRGHASQTATDGAEALVKLRRTRFDAVISDLMMPTMDGFQLTHAIKSDDRMKDIPVIIYTSTYTDAKDEALARNLGANAFIVKPAADETFFTLLDETVARAARGELPSKRISQDELQHLKDYTARLIQKLEDKVEEVSRLNATLEQRVAQATAELREKNAELEAYVNSVTHDLRAPLRAIEGFSSMLLEEGEKLPPEERKRLLGRVASSATKMQQLMQDLLDYSRLKQGAIKLEPVRLEEALEQARERVAVEIARAKAEIEVARPLPSVMAVSAILTQAMANLLSNAVKFVAPGVQPRIEIGAERRGEAVRLLVRDNGVGIAEEDRARIFQVFERLHDPKLYPGSGIGLASVRRAVEKMGGQLGFDSQVGKGSTFWIELRGA